MRPPAFQFYADDFLAGTMLLSDAEVGKYIRCLCIQWAKGGLTDDDLERLGLGLGFSGFTQIKAKFAVDESDGLWKNARLEQERGKQIAFREKQAQNGALGGRPKNPSLSSGLTQTKAKKSSPSPVSNLQYNTPNADGAAAPRVGVSDPVELMKGLKFPSHLLTDDVQTAMTHWIDSRVKHHKPKTPWLEFFQRQINLQLADMTTEEAVHVLKKSASGEYQGLIDPPRGMNGKPAMTPNGQPQQGKPMKQATIADFL